MNPIDLPSPTLHALLACMSESYSLIDAEGRVVATGPHDVDLLGRSRGEVRGLSAFTHVHPDDLPEAQHRFRVLLRTPGGTQGLDVRIRDKDGRWRWLRARGTNLLATDGIGHVLATFADVTAEIQAGAALAARTALAERVVHHLGIGVWVRRLPGLDMVFVSEGVSRIWGRPAGEVLASAASLMASIHPDDRELVAALLPTAGDQTIHFRIQRPDGEVRHLTARRMALVDADGAALSAGVILDVTEETHLREAAGRAEQMETLSRLSLRLAHDFGNFVSAIQASAETLRIRPPTAAVEAEADLIIETCTRAHGLVQRLLLLGRGPSPVLRALALNQEVADMITLLRRCAAPGVSVTLGCSLSDVWVRLDPLELQQILVNLVTNANQAMEGSGFVNIGIEDDGGFGVLTVSDSGPGIPPELRERVFEPFATTRGERGGAGLGLAAVRAIVVGAAGTINVGSSEMGGARFEIRLPLDGARA